MKDLINKIHHADCLDFMKDIPDKSIDLVLTDPPYGVDKKYEGHDDTQSNLLALIGGLIENGNRLSDKMLITPGVNNIYKYPEPEWVLAWWKPNAMTRSAVANCNIWEPILVYNCGYVFGRDGIQVTTTPQNLPGNHPCPKPVKLFEWLISKASKEGDLILDPFSGSGTTAIACHRLNRRFICIEKEKKYVDLSRQRLKEEQAQMRLF